MEEEGPPATDTILDAYAAFVDRWHGAARGRLRCAASCSAPQRSSDDYMVRLHAFAREHGLPFVLHIYESKVQRVAGQRLYGGSLVRHTRRLGVIDELASLVHAVWVDDDDIADIATAGATIVHSPSGNLRCGSGVMPYRRILDAGIPVALCTDEATVEDTSNLWHVGRLAALLHKVSHPDYTTWPSAGEILTSLTSAGARAMRLEGEIGVLQKGARADILLLDLGSHVYLPMTDLANHLVYGEDGGSIRRVLVDGRLVAEDGQLLTIDEEALRADVRRLLPSWVEALKPAEVWARRLRPYFDEMYRRCALADVGLNRWVGDDGEWLARGRWP